MNRTARLLILAGLVVALSGCANCGWQKTLNNVLWGMFQTVKTTKDIAVTLQHDKCKAIAAKCGAETPGKCPALKPCQEVRHKIENGAKLVDRFIAAALLATQLGKEQEAKDLVKKAEAQLVAMQADLKKLGVL